MRDGGGLDEDSNSGDDDKWKIQGYILGIAYRTCQWADVENKGKKGVRTDS